MRAHLRSVHGTYQTVAAKISIRSLFLFHGEDLFLGPAGDKARVVKLNSSSAPSSLGRFDSCVPTKVMFFFEIKYVQDFCSRAAFGMPWR